MHFPGSVSRPAEVRPWEVRFAHPCRAHARHPIHKAMGGHASHGRTSDRAFIRLGWSVSPNTSRRRKKRDRGTLLDLLIMCERPKRRQTFPFSLGRYHAVTEGYETARPGAIVQNSSRRRKKRDRGTLLDLLIMCERRDSNPYARRHQILSLAWLPITTRSQIPSGRLIT